MRHAGRRKSARTSWKLGWLLLGIGMLICADAAEALQATATWTLPADPNRTGVRVERRDGADTNPWVQQGGDFPASQATFNQAGLTVGTRYCYRVITLGDLGTGAPIEACGTPDTPLPASGLSVIFAP